MMVLNFVLNILYYLGIFILEHPILCIALIFVLVSTIIIKTHKPKKTTQLVQAELDLIIEANKRRKEHTAIPEDMICVNCGAPLKAKYAICDYCGARSRMKKDNAIPD